MAQPTSKRLVTEDKAGTVFATPSAVATVATVADAAVATAAAKYAKPGGGIPSADLATPVVTSLGKADTATQPAALASALASHMESFAGWQASLAAADRSQAIQVLSDSTANDPADWPYRLAQSLAALYPAWSVHHRLFNDATQSYGAATVISTGTAGVRCLDGSTGTTTRLLQPDPVNRPHISGPIDVRIKVSLADWTPAALTPLVTKSGGDPLRGWYCGVNTNGTLFFTFSTGGLGADLSTMFSSALASAVFADGATGWLRWVWTPDNGSGSRTLQCYTSTDGASWTALGAITTTAGAVTLYNNAARGYELGGGYSIYPGTKVYEVQIRNGVDGPNIVPALPDLWPPVNTVSATYTGAPVLTVLNGSVAGKDIAYLGDATRLPKLTPDYGQTVAFLATSHNEGISIGLDWTTKYATWRAAVQARLPGASLVALTENPEKTDTSWYREHAKRRLDLVSWCNANRYPVIDTWQSWLDYGAWDSTLMADSVHPNAAGSDVIRDYILSRMTA